MKGISTVLAASSEGGAPSGIGLFFPPLYELIGSAICLGIIALVFYRWVMPAFTKVLDERTAKIEGGIEHAERIQAEAEGAKAEYTRLLAEARTEAATLRDEAREEARAIVADARKAAQAESDRIAQLAERQLEIERHATAIALRDEVGSLAMDLAGRIVGEALTDDARARRVVDRFLDDLESADASETRR